MSDAPFPVRHLLEVTTAIKDGTHGTHRRVAEGVPLLSAKNVTSTGDVVVDETDEQISEADYQELTRAFQLELGDLLLTIVGTLGRRAVFSGQRVAFQRSVAYVRPTPTKLLSRFLFHWMGHPAFVAELKRRSNATAQAGLYLGELAKVALPVPEMREQGTIAKILDTLDTAIHETEAIIAKLKLVKQGLLHDLLTRGIGANGELRPPQAEAPHLYKESPLGWIPKEWHAVELGSITTWASGGTPNRAVASNWIGDIPLLTPKDMKAFELDDATEHISSEAAQAGSRVMPPETVFIVVRGMILAHSFPVVLARRAMAFNQDIKAVSPGPQVDSEFLARWFVANSDLFLRRVTEATHGTKKLDMENLRKVTIELPPVSEQAGIVAREATIDQKIKGEAAFLSKLRTLKSGLMDDLLTGRVRVTPFLEPAA